LDWATFEIVKGKFPGMNFKCSGICWAELCPRF
jgi:hypothetical protein